MKYFLSFMLGILLSLGIFFGYNEFVYVQQISYKNVNFQNLVEDKINKLRQSINNISTINTDSRCVKMNNIKEILDKEYIEPSYVSGTKMWDAAMQAYVAAIGDPFTTYLTSKDNKSLHEELKGSSEFEGIGAVVTKVPEGILIEQVIKDGPAFKAGVKPLDIIIKANDVDLSTLSLGEAVKKIKGPAGTIVNLTIKRDGKIINMKVKRDKVDLKSVNSELITYKGKKIGYISISSVGEETYAQLVNQIKELLSKGIKGLILDLRGNGGGYLDIGYKIGSMWAKEGDIIVQARYRKNLFNRVYRAESTGILHNFPTVILIDSYTASAGEIITAAIKENNPNITKLVGTKTFGKGTIQTMKEFKDGSSLKYTIGKWYTPNNENLSDGVKPGKGLKPDVEVKFDSNLYKTKHIDNQLETAKKTLLNLIK